MASLSDIVQSKQSWRHTLLEQREQISETTRSEEDAAFARNVLNWTREHGVRTVCAYVPVGGEPCSTQLLDSLRGLGCRVLVPLVVARGEPLDWAEYTGESSLAPATFGLLEPTGARLGPTAIAEAEALFVPGLAVDSRGVRLGRGAGHYDRSLPLANEAAPTIVIVRDSEFVDELPGEDHDVRINAVVTPRRGVVHLPM